MIPQENTNSTERRSPKRYGWTFLMIVLCFVLVLFQIGRFAPEEVADLGIKGGYLSVSAPLFTAIFLTLSVFMENSRRALGWSMAIIFYLYLRIYGLGDVFNLIMIGGIMICFEIYTRKK